MNRIYGCKKTIYLVNPVNPVEKTFVSLRVTSWKNIFLHSMAAVHKIIGDKRSRFKLGIVCDSQKTITKTPPIFTEVFYATAN